MNKIILIAVLVLAVSISLAGWFVGQGFEQGRTTDRFVTVRGLAERDVQADIGLWPLRYVAADNDLVRAQETINNSRDTVIAFLTLHGIPREAVQIQRLEVTDMVANPWRSGPYDTRYIVAQTLMVRTEQPDLIRKASQDLGTLVESGVVLSNDGGMQGGPTYLFTRLNDYRPEMIAEATASAREAAQQFAKDSGSRLGGIRQANQGVFVIQARDRAPGIEESGEIDKTIRVVTTVEYYLKD